MSIMEQLKPMIDENDGKWGFVNENGSVVIPAVYDSVEPFKGDYAKAVYRGEVGYIDRFNGWHFFNPDDIDTENHRSPLDIFLDGCSKATDILHKGLKDCE